MKDGAVIRGALDQGDVLQLKEWLGTNIHRYGSTYAPKDLQKRVFGEAYNQERLLQYLGKKFAA